MKVCFVARPNFDKLSSHLYLALKQRLGKNFAAGFITCNAKESSYIKQSVGDSKVYQLNSFIEKHWDELSLEKLCKYEKKFQCYPIWEYIYTDRILIDRPYKYTVKMAAGLFMFFEDIFSTGDYEYYYDEPVSTLLTYAAYIVGEYYGVKYICQMAGRTHVKTHHYFVTDPYQHNAFLKYESDFTDEEIQAADSFLTEFEQNSIEKQNAVFGFAEPKIEWVYLKLAFLELFDKSYKDKFDYINYELYKSHFDRFKFYFRYKKIKKLFTPADYNKKYIYYPLHYQPEASTIVCAQKYEKQLIYIDHIAKSLPADTLLYLKEHYVLLGHKEISFYKEIKRYPNVVLVSPWDDGKKLIMNSQAVITLTGTAGWEAMLLRKPVILGGHIFFDNAPGIMQTNEIYQNYTSLIQSWEKPEREEIINYLCAYFRTLKQGHVYAAIPECYTEENINNLADALIKEVDSLNEEYSNNPGPKRLAEIKG
ncbi:MAG: hypothetical protein DBX47_01050 [Clostridiales bacterium]|nr:MAG: hypothetical protein DBX47_01050 [Clostridiales bacterium]